jgi:hypothetical protein
MDRIGPAGGSPTTLLGDGQQGFIDENLSTAQQGTNVPALYMNALMEEVMNVLAAAGVAPNINTWTQLLASIQTLITNAAAGYVNASGYFYFQLQTPSGRTLIIQGLPVTFAAGVGVTVVPLPISWNAGFQGGVGLDGGAEAYSYGVATGSAGGGNALTDLTIYCPTVQLVSGSISPRTGAAGYIIAWGY